jgi:truncated hemoglobin YjbI
MGASMYNFDDHNPTRRQTVAEIARAWGVEPLDVESKTLNFLRHHVHEVNATESHFAQWKKRCLEFIASIGDNGRKYSPLAAAEAIASMIRGFRP